MRLCRVRCLQIKAVSSMCILMTLGCPQPLNPDPSCALRPTGRRTNPLLCLVLYRIVFLIGRRCLITLSRVGQVLSVPNLLPFRIGLFGAATGSRIVLGISRRPGALLVFRYQCVSRLCPQARCLGLSLGVPELMSVRTYPLTSSLLALRNFTTTELMRKFSVPKILAFFPVCIARFVQLRLHNPLSLVLRCTATPP